MLYSRPKLDSGSGGGSTAAAAARRTSAAEAPPCRALGGLTVLSPRRPVRLDPREDSCKNGVSKRRACGWVGDGPLSQCGCWSGTFAIRVEILLALRPPGATLCISTISYTNTNTNHAPPQQGGEQMCPIAGALRPRGSAVLRSRPACRDQITKRMGAAASKLGTMAKRLRNN